MQDTYKISDFKQFRLLADPLKLQILRAFAENAKTTKQVAIELEENVTKLYRHVDALHDAGLLEIAEEKKKRGTIERTFRAIARRFEADPTLFSEDASEEVTSATREFLSACEAEILKAITRTEDDEERKAIVVRLRCKASPRKIAELRAKLTEWIDSLTSCEEDLHDEDSEEFGGLVAFYPID